MEGQGDTVDNVGVHAVENLARGLEGVDDSGQPRSQEHDVGSRTGGVRSTFDCYTSIGLLEGGSVVDTVTCWGVSKVGRRVGILTSHGNEIATLLENLY